MKRHDRTDLRRAHAPFDECPTAIPVRITDGKHTQSHDAPVRRSILMRRRVRDTADDTTGKSIIGRQSDIFNAVITGRAVLIPVDVHGRRIER